MDDRPDELFLIDVDQEAKELAQYGAGIAELSADRLTSSLHYLSSLLVSLDLHAHASFASSFARAAKRMEEGEARRTARDFAEMLRRRIDAIRSDNQDDQVGDVPESFWERLPEAYRIGVVSAPMQSGIGERADPAKSRSVVFEDAARTLAAADEFAALLRTRSLAAKPVQSSLAPGMGTEKLLEETQAERMGESGEGIDWDDTHDEADQPEADPGEAATLASFQVEVDQVEADHGEAAKLASFRLEVDQVEAAQSEVSQFQASRRDLALVPALSVASVDECFRRAVRIAEGDVQVWPPGMQALFDSIDELDRVPLEDALPQQVQLVGGADAKISYQLALAIRKVLEQAPVRGGLEAVADAMVVSHTLIMSLQCAEPLMPTPIARFAANFAGRLELSEGDRRIRLTLPASKRLLRIVPLRLGDDWFAVPWAQFVGMEDSALGGSRSVLVSLGNTPDRIRVDEVGLVSVGVWYELPKPLRHRDRYRGVALVSRGNPLPVFG